MISVLIATRDRARLLEVTLGALTGQEWPGQPYEVLVVDNASADDTRSVVEAAAARSPVPIVSLHEARSGKSRALNTAVAHARGDLLVLTDDDVVPSPGWLGAYARAFENPSVDYAVGRILPLWEASPPSWMSPALYGVLAIPDGGTKRLPLGRRLNDHIMPIGANMAVRRRVIDQIGGWNPDLGKLQHTLRTGEDHEFALKMTAAGLRGVYEPDAWVRHRVPADRLTRRYFRQWFFENGAIVAGLEARFPTTNRYVLGVPRYLWRQALVALGSSLSGRLTGDTKRAVAGEMRVRWFAGYLLGRWREAGATGGRLQVQEPTASTEATVPRSWT
jgi:cellulose synthase/poly-beta-1,6-N-acetylglucosamine synthase-like glycosyltransferase